MTSPLCYRAWPMSDTVFHSVPLCVDLDGTLIKTDLLFESFARLLKRRPWLLLLTPFWCFKGRAGLKRNLARRVSIDIASLPYNFSVLEWLNGQKAVRRQLLLVSAADDSLANQVSSHLGIFDRVIASDGRSNLKGKRKLEEIRQFVSGEFEYVGNSRADLDIWLHCSAATTVGASAATLRRLKKHTRHVTTFDTTSGRLRHYVAALRAHQWAKNLMVFLPLITSHQFLHPELLFKAFVSCVLFSLCSSAQYILNDLVDLEDDRRHAAKRRRPFACGDVPIVAGFVLAPFLLAVSVTGALLLSKLFAVALAGYFILSFAYSLSLKRFVLLDAFVLSGLHMLRIVVGHLVTGVPFSVWLLSFAFFVFLSLAMCKRWAELRNLRSIGGKVSGRGYRADDAEQVNMFGVASGFLSAVIFILYLQSERVRELYRQPELLWLLAPTFLYWISRLWVRSARGEVSEDPVLFVLKDGVTYVIAALSGLIMLAATLDWRSVS